MLPSDIATVSELVAYCRTQGIRYVAYTSIEYSSRPDLRVLWEAGRTFPGLERIVSNKVGVVFRVAGM